MAAAADETSIQFSLSDQSTEFDMMTKQVVWVPDQNSSGQYPSGQILFDMASISNSGKYLDTNQSTLVIPLVLNVNIPNSATNNTNAGDAFIASLKAGNHHLINSMSVELTNNQIVNLTNFSNLDINYRLLTGQSMEDLQNFGYTFNYVKDTAESLVYAPASSTTGNSLGVGECNNNIVPTLFSVTGNGYGDTIFQYNDGRFKRMAKSSYDPVAFYNSSASQRSFLTNAAAGQSGKDFVQITSSAGKTTNVTYFILATIPLRILHPVFNKLPLIKGSYFRIILNTNTACTTTVNMVSSTYTGYTTTSLNNVLPFQISPIYANNATGVTTGTVSAAAATNATQTFASLPAGIFPSVINQNTSSSAAYGWVVTNVTGSGATQPTAGTYVVSVNYSTGVVVFSNPFTTVAASTVVLTNTQKSLDFSSGATANTLVATLGIGKSLSANAVSHPSFTTCRLYATLYEMTPLYQEKYMEMLPTKRIVYNDILSFQSLGVTKGTQVSQILTNGVSRPRYLLIVPQIAAQIHGTTNLATDGSTVTGGASVGTPMNSPFSSSPATTAPYSAISNFNVLISGTALYQSNIQYGFEHFLQEVRGSNSLNGGLQMGLSSGVLSQQEWESAYRYVFVDMSRRPNQANDDVSRSIQVVFNNAANYTMDYYYIIGYEREITVSTQTGSLVI